MVRLKDGFSYQLSILKSANGNPDSVQRFFFDYAQPESGVGRFIHTYRCDGSPIPSFEGEPTPVSYTHLDVYKRQGEDCAMGFMMMFLVEIHGEIARRPGLEG